MFEKNTGKSATSCVVVRPAPLPVLRRRSLLKASASGRALLTVQAAMSVGITLAGPLHAAHAQTSLPTTNNTVVLSHYGVGDNPFTISNGTIVSTDFNGIYGSAGRYTLSNAGTVISSEADGILFNGGGTVITSGTVNGAMSGNYAGILLNNRTSTIENSGLITGNTGAGITHGGIINNSGTIGGGVIGALVSGQAGNVYNSGNITGATAVQLRDGGAVDNGDSIVGGTIGVDISGGAGVVNNWSEGPNVITGGAYGVVISSPGGTLITRGTVFESGDAAGNAAVMMDGGYIFNKAAVSTLSAGLIRGNNYGVLGTGAQALDIRNSGAIEGFVDGVTFGAGGGTIVNAGTAFIGGSEYAGINATSGSLNVSNAGTIAGGNYGISAHTSTPALYGQLGGVTVSNTGTITGGHNAIWVNTGFTSITNSGTILSGGGDAIDALTNGEVINTGSIIAEGGAGIVINGSFGVVHNNGSQTANFIYGTYAGVDINAPNGTLITRGVVSEQAHGSLYAAVIMNGGYLDNQGSSANGDAGIITGYSNGVINAGTDAIDIVNDGLINGTGTPDTWTNGIWLQSAGGTIFNGVSAVIAGGSGNGILSNFGSLYVNNEGRIWSNGYGIDVYQPDTIGAGGGVSVSNSGTIIGMHGGIYVSTGYASIQNSGLIYGGDDEGIYTNDGATINNNGTVIGGGDGIEAYNGLTAGNTGTISGVENGIYVASGVASIMNTGSITGVDWSGIILQGGGTVFNSGTVTGGEYGVTGLSIPLTVGNSGLIIGTTKTGVALYAGGNVYNAGAGTIIGNFEGVGIGNGYGSVINHGVILGNSFAGVGIYDNGTVTNIGGTIIGYSGVQFGYAAESIASTGGVSNFGTIIGNSFAGVAMYNAGGVFNAVGGTIEALSSAGLGIVMYGTAGFVTNGGFISGGSLGVGVSFAADGVLLNGGSIYGGTGVKIAGTLVPEDDVYSTGVQNFGLITGGSVGVELVNGGVIGNGTFDCDSQIGVIYGSLSGVQVDGGTGYVDNVGTIEGGINGVSLAGSLGLVGNHNFVANSTLHIGDIFGGISGVLVTNGAGMVYNAGIIHGDIAGVGLFDGGVVQNAIYTTTIDSEPVTFAGTISGSEFGVYVSTLAAGTVLNAGFIGGGEAGVDLMGGGTVVNDATGGIIGESYGVRIGTLPGYVNNAGFINGWGFNTADRAVDLVMGGEVINQYGGLIRGSEGGIQIGGSTTDTLAAPGIVLNSGTVFASCGSGIVMLNGGYVSNSSSGVVTAFNGDNPGDGVALYANLTISNAIVNAGGIYGQDNGVEVGGVGLFTLFNAGSINGGLGVYIHASTVGTDVVMNTGSIQGFNDSGVILRGAGAFYLGNSGTIIGINSESGVEVEADQIDIVNSGSITGGFGIYANSSYANITNLAAGTITGTEIHGDGVYAYYNDFSLDNAGLITGTDGAGVGADSGTIANILNESTGTISGYYDGMDLYDTTDLVDNRGQFTGATVFGIYTDGDLTDILNEADGTITGGEYGIYAEGDTLALENAGTITGNADEGIYAYGTSSIINEATGTIAGPDNGVVLDGDYGSLQNAGLIEGEYAVDMESSLGSLLNLQTGVITGSEEGVYSEYGENVFNAGQITGYTKIGVQLYNGGELVNSGAIFGATYGVSDYGGTQRGSVSNFVTIFNSGIINGNGIGVQIDPVTGDEIVNEAGGIITGGTYGIEVGYANASAAAFGTVFNAGTIAGGTTGIYLYNGGSVTNYASGTIVGGQYGIQAGYAGNTLANIATVENAGFISGQTDAILLTQGGVVGNSASGIISGGSIGIDAPGVTNVFNAGEIAGGVTGVDLGAGGSVVNTGLITGGTDGLVFTAGDPAYVLNDGHITGGTGVGVQLEGGDLFNESKGVITGGADGVIAQNGATIVNAGKIVDSPAPGHAGVVLYGQTSLTNLAGGTISGNAGVLVSGDQATIVDAGAIISTDGGDAIQVLPSADPVQITLTTGAKLTGAIDGGGTGGSITLTGQNTLDNTIANFGAGSTLTVAPGATWAGAGSWTIANVNNTGTFQAGLLNAPLDLTGNFTSTGTLQVVVTPTISTVLNVSGTATFSGGLTYIFAPGTYTPGYKYDFVDAAGGAKGEFTTVNYVGATPEYVSKTTNVLISGDILGSNLVLGRVAPLDGSVFADANQDAAQNAQAANDSLLGHAAGGDDANAAACAAASRVMPGQTDMRGTNLATQMTSAVANAFCGAGGWIEATGATSSIDASNGVPGYDANDAGFLAGLDRPVTGFGTKLGVAVGYDSAWLDDKAGGKASADTVRVGLYAAQPVGQFTIAADIMYGSASNRSTRQTGVGAASGSYGGNIVNGGVQISTGLDVNGLAVTPEAGVKFADVNANGFREAAPIGLRAFAVSPQTSSYASVQPYLDVGLSKSFTTESLITITPSVSAGYQLEAGDRGKSVNTTAQDSTLFIGGHNNLDAGGAKIGASIAAGKNNWSLYARYNATLAGNYTAQSGEAGLQINF